MDDREVQIFGEERTVSQHATDIISYWVLSVELVPLAGTSRA